MILNFRFEGHAAGVIFKLSELVGNLKDREAFSASVRGNTRWVAGDTVQSLKIFSETITSEDWLWTAGSRSLVRWQARNILQHSYVKE